MFSARKYLPLAAFCIYFAKVTILPSSYPEAVILLILGSVAAYFEYKSNDKKIAALEEQFKAQQKDLEDKAKDIEHLKSSITSMKLSAGMRPLGNTGSR